MRKNVAWRNGNGRPACLGHPNGDCPESISQGCVAEVVRKIEELIDSGLQPELGLALAELRVWRERK